MGKLWMTKRLNDDVYHLQLFEAELLYMFYGDGYLCHQFIQSKP